MNTLCDYENCKARLEIEHINKRLDEGTQDFKEIRKEYKHVTTLLNNVVNTQTALSGQIMTFTNENNLKNEMLIRSISDLKIHLENHTKDEMKMQKQFLDAIDSLNKSNGEQDKKLSVYGFKIHLLWGGATLLFLLFWEKIKKALGG